MGNVIFNADDFGYSRAINMGIIDAHKHGILTSTTLMANTPGFEHAVELSKENPNLGIGVHLTLTHGRPLLEGHKTIVKEDGSFRNIAFYERTNFVVDPEEVYAEWDAQIQKVIKAGIVPTHLDSHHHAHTFGINREIVIELARKYNLPVRNNLSLPDDIRHTNRFEMNFDFVGRNSELRQEKYLENLIEDFKRFETTEVMCHPGYLDYEVLSTSSLTENRVKILNFIINSQFSRKLKENKDITLATYNCLK
ncbi:chitin disaccharide deacetylase [Tissierella sp. MSJ-40]|uniref:Chitin disaccharide deacetylase n=1 Tax=Tissierella simiarum TaxID=2841534 RepID=A0ABS6E264_9FIRM|nr:chitin disaccharide deacetylase [Tissierella simiarum]MBU5436994.1 chitin disaccharide deacetylase [Tissierella simiarum]